MKPIRIFTLLVLCAWVQATVFAQTDTSDGTAPKNGNRQATIQDIFESILAWEEVGEGGRFEGFFGLPGSPDTTIPEIEALAIEQVVPSIVETWDDDARQRNINLSCLYNFLGSAYREWGGDDRNEKERYYKEKSLEAALDSESDLHIAYAYNICGDLELRRGNVPRAHELLYESVHFWERAGQLAWASSALYTIASNFMEMRDVEGLGRVAASMEEYLKRDDSKQSHYQYNVIKHSYFERLLERDTAKTGEVDYTIVDSALVYTRANIDIVENHIEELSPNWFHGYAYYFHAKILDEYYPTLNEHIFETLLKAVETTERDLLAEDSGITNQTASFKEFIIMVNSITTRAFFRLGNTVASRQILDETLELLSELEDQDNLNAIRSKVYEFAVEFHEKTGDHSGALRFQKLFTANEARSHEREKMRAINDMSAKYDTERKQMRIETLTHQNRTTRIILWLTLGLSLAIVAGGLLVNLLGRQRRKNVEQQLYETALLAELRQGELEKMQELGRQLEQNPVADTIDKIARQVADSHIDAEAKKTYLNSLSHIDSALLENVWRGSDGRLTPLDMKYIICFNAGLSVSDIGTIFSIEPASVNTVRYRIRKKFAQNDPFRTII